MNQSFLNIVTDRNGAFNSNGLALKKIIVDALTLVDFNR
jgi:hypothetical protein